MKKLIFGVVASLAAVGLLNAAGAQPISKPTGTYTSLHFNNEGGDLVGQELKIVLTRDGYQGALQFAEGGPERLILVDVHVQGPKITFTIPDTDSGAGEFAGLIRNGILRGTFKYKGGAEEQVQLRKGKSYWD